MPCSRSHRILDLHSCGVQLLVLDTFAAALLDTVLIASASVFIEVVAASATRTSNKAILP